MTTIQVSQKTKERLRSFGTKGDTYEDVINHIYSIAVKTQLREFLMSSDDTITLEEARRRHKQRWSKSK